MTVRVEQRGPVCVVTIDNPERRNALDGPTYNGIGDAFMAAAEDDAVRCLVLTAVGDRAFCSGMDLRAGVGGLGALGPGPGVFTEHFYAKPIVAAVNGAAMGGGLGIALGCDVIVAVEDAVFGLPEVRRGLVGAGAATRAAIRLTPAVAMELGLTGQPITAARAYEIGLVNRVVERDRLLPTALEIAEQIAENAPLAVRATKQIMHDVLALGRTDMAAVRAQVAHVAASADAAEGRTAWIERRPPAFEGR